MGQSNTSGRKVLDIDQPKEIREQLLKYAMKPKGMLLMAGNNGTGKTHAAMQIYHANTPFELPMFDATFARFYKQVELFMIWQKMQYDYGNTDSLVDELSKTRLLVLDDIGTRAPTEPFGDFLYLIVDRRYEAREHKGTVITSNLNSEQMRTKFGDPFYSRVASGLVLKIVGQDRRLNKRDQTC